MAANTHALVRLGHLVFWGGRGSEGFFVDDGGLEGWSDAPTTRGEDIEIPQGHGSYDSAEFYDSRVVTVSGVCSARSPGQLGQYRNELMGVLQGRVQVLVDDLGVKTYAHGRRFGQPKFKPDAHGRRAQFQFSVRCADPRRYGERVDIATVAAGTAQTVWHRGNFPAAPVQVVAGSMPNGYRLDGPDGRSLTVGRALAAGAPHTIDHSTGVLSIGGVAQFGAITGGGFWTLNPGRTATHTLVPVSGTGTLESIVRDTYI